MAPAAAPLRRVYLATATGVPLPSWRVVRVQPTRGVAPSPEVGHYPVQLPRPKQTRAEYVGRAVRELTEVLGCFLGIDLLRLIRFITTL